MGSRHYCSTIRSLCGGLAVTDALAVFWSMCSRSLSCDLVTGNLLVAACAGSQRVEEAFRVVERLAADGLAPNTFTVAAIMEGCNSRGRGLFSVALRAWMLLPPGAASSSAPADLVAGLVDAAEATMLRSHSLADAKAVLEQVCRLEGLGSAAVERLHGALLQVCAAHGEVRAAMDEFASMQAAHGITPTTDHYNSVITACVEGGALDVGLAVFDRMIDDVRRQPAAAAAAGAGAVAAALSSSGGQAQPTAAPQPDYTTYRILLSACRRRGMLEKGLELLAASGLSSDPSALEVLSHTVEVATRWDRKALAEANHTPGLLAMMPHQLRPAPVDRLRLLELEREAAAAAAQQQQQRPAMVAASGHSLSPTSTALKAAGRSTSQPGLATTQRLLASLTRGSAGGGGGSGGNSSVSRSAAGTAAAVAAPQRR